MKFKPQTSIAADFADLDEPRIDRSKDNLLIDILTMAILEVICGADGWVGIKTDGKAKHDWLISILQIRVTHLRVGVMESWGVDAEQLPRG